MGKITTKKRNVISKQKIPKTGMNSWNEEGLKDSIRRLQLEIREIGVKKSLLDTVACTNHNVTIRTFDGESSNMYGICCCCLELPSLKSLWSEYMWMGQSEVYGEMLKDCFNLIWEQNEMTKERICEVCITQLRNALQFKQRVVQSQARLHEKLVDTTNQFKEEIVLENKGNEMDGLTVYTNTYSKGDEYIESLHVNDDVPGDDSAHDMFDDDTTLINAAELDQQPVVFADVAVACPENRKSVKRKTSTKNRKQMGKCKRTILIIPKGRKDNHEGKPKKIEFRNVSYVKPRQNACLILEHSTIVPFKSNKGYFTCLYCNKQHVGFDELKSHILQLHENMTFKTILKSINRPHDRIKADVSDITCRICRKKIDNLENLVSHLTESHKITFIEDDVKKPADSILAYELSDGKFRCFICKNEFLFFKTLTNHMNTHSNDYVCDVCGRCFLLAERLRAHIQMHIDGQSVKCEFCDKICVSHFALKSHIRYRHKKLSYMCSICNLNFNTYRLRMRHLEEVHKRAPLNLTCRICSKQYSQPNSLNSHMRLEHLNIVKEPKHSCNVCGTLFKTPNALASHLLVHSGEKKFECHVCHKKYARAKTLTEHLKIHRNDRRWTCRACSQAFVQKCSLKNHIRVHHADMDYEDLIVYKKPDLDSK